MPFNHQALRGGFLECVKICSAFGAERIATHAPSKRKWSAVEFAAHKGHGPVEAWLQRSVGWMELHHLEMLTSARTLELLRAGAAVDAKGTLGDTPLSLARELGDRGKAHPNSPAALVLCAAEPWSPQTNSLFPAPAQARALQLLCIGQQLSQMPCFAGEASGFLDVWRAIVVPKAISRDCASS